MTARVDRRGFCVGPENPDPTTHDVGVNRRSACPECGQEVAVMALGRLARHKPPAAAVEAPAAPVWKKDRGGQGAWRTEVDRVHLTVHVNRAEGKGRQRRVLSWYWTAYVAAGNHASFGTKAEMKGPTSFVAREDAQAAALASVPSMRRAAEALTEHLRRIGGA